MTPEQKTALEGVVGRLLMPSEEAAIDALLPDRQDMQIAGVLSAGRTKLGGIGTNDFAKWAAKTGQRATIEDTASTPLDSMRSIALSLLDLLRGNLLQGLDLGDADVLSMVGTWLASGKMTQPQYESLITLATNPDPIHFNTVSDALNIAEGRLTLGAL